VFVSPHYKLYTKMLKRTWWNWWNVWNVNIRRRKVSEKARKGLADWKPNSFRSLIIHCIYKLRRRFHLFIICVFHVRFKSLWRWYINTIIDFLDIIYHPIFIYLKQRFGDWD
jgi:hypothetical protein